MAFVVVFIMNINPCIAAVETARSPPRAESRHDPRWCHSICLSGRSRIRWRLSCDAMFHHTCVIVKGRIANGNSPGLEQSFGAIGLRRSEILAQCKHIGGRSGRSGSFRMVLAGTAWGALGSGAAPWGHAELF